MKADAWHYELVGSQMGMVVMEYLTPWMVISLLLSTAESEEQPSVGAQQRIKESIVGIYEEWEK